MTPNTPHLPSQRTRRHVLQAGLLASSLGFTPFVRSAPAQQATTPFRPPPRLASHFRQLFGRQDVTYNNVSVSLPALAENGNSVALSVSGTAQEDDAVEYLMVFAEKNPLPDVVRLRFHENSPAQSADLRIRLSDSQQIFAVAVTKRGRLHAGAASIVVTLAACVDIPGPADNNKSTQPSADPTAPVLTTNKPSTASDYLAGAIDARTPATWKSRLAVASDADNNQRLRIRTLLAHPMESGFRVNDTGQPIPRDIITHFHCEVLNRRALTAQFFPAVAANPYLSFQIQSPDTAGALRCVWVDQQGAWANAQAELPTTA